MCRRGPNLSTTTRSGGASLAAATAAVLGSLPGFTLPFVAAAELTAGEADLLLLALSVGITASIVVNSAVELTTVAEYGRQLGRDREPGPSVLRRYRWQVTRFGLVLAVVVVPALVVAYAARTPERAAFLPLAAAVAATPVVSAVASRMSGECIARGAPVIPIALQGMRSLLPAMVLLAWSGAPLLLYAAMLPVGEAVRAGVLTVSCRRLRERQATGRGEPTGTLEPHGLVAQSLSSGVTQLGPAVDRTFLSASGAGAVSSYEISDRLMYAASQFFTMTFLYRRLAAWARLPTMEREPAHRLLRGDARVLGGMIALLTAAGVAGCGLALASGRLPADWHTGFLWGTVVMLSLPAHLFNVIGTRMLVIGRRQRFLLWMAAGTAILNAVLDALLYRLLGPVGIVVSTVLVRWASAGVYLHLLRRVVPATIGQERPSGEA